MNKFTQNKFVQIIGPFIIGIIIIYLSVGIVKFGNYMDREFSKPRIQYTNHEMISDTSSWSQPSNQPLMLMPMSPYVPGHPLQSIAPKLEIVSTFANVELPLEPAGEIVEFADGMISYIPSAMTQFLKTCDCKIVYSGVQSTNQPDGSFSTGGPSAGGGSLPPVFTNPNQNQMSPQ